MTDSELKGILEAYERNALGYQSSELSSQREQAMKYYLGELFGDEQEGRSQVVSTDVADTVEWILPSLLKVFTAGEDVIRCDPVQAEDEALAKQATEYCNWVFQKDNSGFMVFHAMFKDALLQKNGTCKVYWEEPEDEEPEEQELTGEAYIGLTIQEMQGKIEIVEHEQEGDVHRVKINRLDRTGKVCIEPIPPEEFLVSRQAKGIDWKESPFVAHRTQKTVSELLEMGYRKEVIDRLSDEDEDLTAERLARYDDVEDLDDPDIDRSMRQIWVTEAYLMVDYDGDGIGEKRKVTYAGNEILDNEPWKGPRPFASVTPVPMSHRFTGRSVADLVMDLQKIKSAILRQFLDNLYLNNNQRSVISDQVNLDDMLVSRPGGIIRLKTGALPSAGHVMPLATPFVAQAAFPALEYLDGVRENRTGVTRYNQGVDANSLNKTASGITQIMSAAQQRIELIARIFAETGVKDIFKLILFNLTTYQDKARTIRLRNQWVPMDPSEWKNGFDITINVGLGTGNRDQMLAHLMNLANIQKEIVGLQGGLNGPLVTADNVYNLLSKISENSGYKGGFFTNPQEAGPPPPPPPDPKMIEVQGKQEVAKAQLQMDQQKTQAQLALEKQKTEAQLQLEWQKTQAGLEMERQKMMLEHQAKGEMFGKELEARKSRDVMDVKAGMGISPDNEHMEEMKQGMLALADLIVQATQQQAQMLQGIYQAVTQEKNVEVVRGADGRVQGAKVHMNGTLQ
jgi:hypothetical protein